MSTQENKQLVIEGYRLYQRGQISELLNNYHDDAEWTGPELELVPFSGTFRGKVGIAQYFSELDASVHANSFEPTRFIPEGDNVVVTGLANWVAKPTGRTYDCPWVHVFTLRDGKVARFECYYDTAATEKAFQPGPAASASSTTTVRH